MSNARETAWCCSTLCGDGGSAFRQLGKQGSRHLIQLLLSPPRIQRSSISICSWYIEEDVLYILRVIPPKEKKGNSNNLPILCPVTRVIRPHSTVLGYDWCTQGGCWESTAGVPDKLLGLLHNKQNTNKKKRWSNLTELGCCVCERKKLIKNRTAAYTSIYVCIAQLL